MTTKELFSLDGRVALVTGGSRGLGLRIALGLGEMGARVGLVARQQSGLDEATTVLNSNGIAGASFVANLANPGSARSLVSAVLEQFGTIDILVNNAGTTWAAPAEDYPDDAWRRVMAVNLDAAFALSREVGRRVFIPRSEGKVLNIASVAGLGGNAPQLSMQTIAYNTSKGALMSFTRALAAEWGGYNINVNALCPGFFRTRMSRVTADRNADYLLQATPLRRLGGEDDLMGAAVFLVSDAARHITGQCLAVDGGLSVT